MNPLVIKVGGAFMQATAEALQLLTVIKQLQQSRPVVLVHGGGPMVEQLLQALQFTSTKVNGLRVTPPEHMPYITGALAGTANKQLCAFAIRANTTPVGLCLADGAMTSCSVLDPALGAVGVAKANSPTMLNLLLEANILPIISSIGADEKGNLLNVNADQAATVIAQLLNADLLLLSNVPGVLDHNKHLINQLTAQGIAELVESGVIIDGMQVKVDAALDAATSLQRPITIASWQTPEQLLGLLAGESVGTTIIPNI